MTNPNHTPDPKKETLWRIRLLLGLLCLGALLIVIKLYFVQIVDGKDYIQKADSQYIKPNVSTFDRGTIYFQSNDGTRASAASVKDGYVLIMNPQMMQLQHVDPEQAYDAVTQYIPLDKTAFMQKAAKPGDQYEKLADKLDRDTGASLASLTIPGINAYPENWRVYPGGQLASQTIGLIGNGSDNQIIGRYGLERQYQDVLDRTTNAPTVNFFAQLFSDIQQSVFQGSAKQGDIVTTIDPTVQNYLEETLKDTQAVWNSDSIGGVVMDPKTGDIVAMASRPTFDPNDISTISDPSVFSNPLIENVYEMGSIIKPLTMAAGIDSGAITTASTYDDTGCVVADTKKICNFDFVARGVIPVQQILNQSLNVGASWVEQQIGNDEFTRYFKSFGLGDKTGIDLPNEQAGIVSNLDSKRNVEHETASFGQGIAMSALATTRALAILANGGKLITPHLVSEIDYTDGTVQKITPDPGTQVIKKETADTITGMLIKVVDEAIATAHPGIHMEHYSIAAKTGTAQIADHVNGGYYGDRYLHSFFGYFPAYNPRFIVFLYQVWPKGAEYASATLTDPFIDMAKFLINYYEITPDR